MHKIALSVDVEDCFNICGVSSADKNPNESVKSFQKKYKQSRGNLHDPIYKLLEIYKEHNIQATFFIVADLVEDYLDVFREIVKHGHEIACHGLHHIEYRGDGTSQEVELFCSNVMTAKSVLEDSLGTEVVGFRAPTAYFRSWMIQPLLEMGFSYDSSIAVNSLYEKFEREPVVEARAPFFWPECDNASLFEIPWPFLSVCGFKLPVGGGPAFRLLGSLGPFFARMGLKQTLKYSDTSFYIHPLDIGDSSLPQEFFMQRKNFWRNKGSKTLERYTKVLDTFSGSWTTCKDVWLRGKGDSKNI